MDDSKGLLAVWMDAPPELEDDLNAWYSSEHLAERIAIPGFLSARRYVSLQGEPKYIALYRLTDVGVLQSEAYQAAAQNPTPETTRVTGALTAFIRNEYALEYASGDLSAAAAPYVFLVRIECDLEYDEEMRRWYGEEHLPAIAGVEGVQSARLYRATVGTPRLLAAYEVAAPEIPGSPVWRAAIDSPWTDKMRPLFKNRSNNLGRLIDQR